MQQSAYILLALISTMLSVAAAVYAWGRRSSAGASYLAAMLLAAAVWSFGYSMELAHTEKEVICFWLKFEYLGIAFLPLWCMLFAFRYAGLDRWLTPGNIAAMSVVPVFTLLLNWTNEWHGLIYSKVDVYFLNEMPLLATTKGIWYWVNIGYSYLSLLLMAWLLVRMSWRKGPLYRNQVRIIVVAALLPWSANILYLSGLSPFPNLDLSPFTFSVMGIVLIFGLFHFRIFNVMPVVRDVLIENMSDGVLVLNNEWAVVDINPAASRLTGLFPSSSIGRDIDAMVSSWPEFLSSCRDEHIFQHEIPGRDNPSQCLDMNVIRLIEPSGHNLGRLIVVRDITARKQLEGEREGLIRNLQDALDRVRTLRGLLPICASCKKIRDDHGYWHQVEVYIHEHSGADFSHGLCPECSKKLYPEFYDETGIKNVV